MVSDGLMSACHWVDGWKGAQDDVKWNGCNDDDVIEAVPVTGKARLGFFSSKTTGSTIMLL